MSFNRFPKTENDPLIYGQDETGRYVGFENPNQFTQSGGQYQNVETVAPGTIGNFTNFSQYTPSQTGNAELDATLKQVKDYLDKLHQAGYTINQNVEITPDKVAEFTKQASDQIHPYYANQLKAATSQFLTTQGYGTDNLLNNEKQLQNTYSNNLRTLSENAAERGMALSGGRVRDEGQLANDTQNTIDTNRRTLEYNAGNNAATFAQKYGGAQVPTAPTYDSTPRVLSGQSQFSTDTSNRNLYQLSPEIYQNLIGSEQNAEKTATTGLQKQLETNYQQGQTNTQLRALQL